HHARRRGAPGAVTASPLDRALLRRVDLVGLARAEEERLHVRHQHLAGRLLPDVQAVMVDERGLVTQPLVPAPLADGVVDPLAEFVPERRPLEPRGLLAASDASDLSHSLASLPLPVRMRAGIMFGLARVPKGTPAAPHVHPSPPCTQVNTREVVRS